MPQFESIQPINSMPQSTAVSLQSLGEEQDWFKQALKEQKTDAQFVQSLYTINIVKKLVLGAVGLTLIIGGIVMLRRKD